MKRFALPPLSYGYGALEPHIDGRIMELHHDKHHRAYVDGANAALDALEDARTRDDPSRLGALEHALAFNLSGHVLHAMFWQNLSPTGGREPKGELALAVQRDFGSFDACKRQLAESAAMVMGSGWGALAWEPLSGRLLTFQLHDHQAELAAGSVPLLVIDAWEHAYYLQYGPARREYLAAIWNIVDWADVARRYDSVRTLDLGLVNATLDARAVRAA